MRFDLQTRINSFLLTPLTTTLLYYHAVHGRLVRDNNTRKNKGVTKDVRTQNPLTVHHRDLPQGKRKCEKDP